MSTGFSLVMRRLMEAAAAGYLILTLIALAIPPGSSIAAVAMQPIIITLLGPPAVMLSGGDWSSFAFASGVVAVPAAIAWAIWRYDPAMGVGLFWTAVACLAWLGCGWLAWATRVV